MLIAAALLSVLDVVPLWTQEPVDSVAVAALMHAAAEHPQAARLVTDLADTYGPRLTGSPATRAAARAAMRRLASWGLVDARLEPWGPFGSGWSNERVTAAIVRPWHAPLIA
jgi:carboxypeptidase Q